MKICVTGGAGYIGNLVVASLLERGHEVTVLDNLLFGDGSLQWCGEEPRFRLIRGDIRHIEDLVEGIRGAKAVVHLAGIVGNPACSVNEQATRAVNVEATKALIEICKLHRIRRFLFASSCSVYGASDLPLVEEGSPLNPVSLYAESKIASEQIILHNSNNEGPVQDPLRPTILRIGTVFGASRRMRFDLVVNIFTAKAAMEGEISVYGGEQFRSLVHVSDVASAFVAVMEAPLEKIEHQIFNVGNDALNLRILRVGKQVQKLIPNAQLQVLPRQEDRRNYRVSSEKIRREIGWEAQKGLEEGILEMKAKIEENAYGPYTDERYFNSKYPYL